MVRLDLCYYWDYDCSSRIFNVTNGGVSNLIALVIT